MVEKADDDQHSMHMRFALDVVDALETANLIVIPREPTDDMIAAGAAAGRLDRETVYRVYAAMIRAVDQDDDGAAGRLPG